MTDENERDPQYVIDLYLDGARFVEEAISGLSGEDLDDAPDDGNWSIRQIIHHLADGDDLWSLAIKMALGSDGTIFDLHWYWETPQVQWARNWAYAQREIRPALEALAANRRYTIDLVMVIPGGWEHFVLVPWPNQAPGRLTVGEILAMQARHVCGHIEEIRKIRGQHGI